MALGRPGRGYALFCRSGDREVAVRRMFPGDARRARSIGRRITDARRAGNRDKELRYRKRAEAMIEQFGPEAQHEIENGRRDRLRSKRG